MATISGIHILATKDGYVVSGHFYSKEIKSAEHYETYGEALAEMRRQIDREAIRYEAFTNRNFLR